MCEDNKWDEQKIYTKYTSVFHSRYHTPCDESEPMFCSKQGWRTQGKRSHDSFPSLSFPYAHRWGSALSLVSKGAIIYSRKLAKKACVLLVARKDILHTEGRPFLFPGLCFDYFNSVRGE